MRWPRQKIWVVLLRDFLQAPLFMTLFGHIKHLVVLTMSFFLIGPCAGGVLFTPMFTEGFESPSIPLGTDSAQAPGTHTFDNPDWVISSTDEFGVYLNHGGIPFLGSTSQVLAFGGGNSAGPNVASILVDGFIGFGSLKISFDHFSTANANQGILVEITDPNNSDALLYSSGNVFGAVTITDATSTGGPVGDSVELTISQVGNTASSDSGIDNIVITGVVPEPSVLLLLGLGGVAALRRRRK